MQLQSRVEVANSFMTIDPNVGVVEVPDLVYKN